jgi:MATE family multidrug resistance protein
LLLQSYIDYLQKSIKVCIEKLWHILGPAIFSRIVSYSMLVITQAFAGHDLGDLDLAAISIAYNVVVGLVFGLLVHLFT